MKLTFIGTGSAFTIGTHNYQSNMVLQNDEGQNLLIDCGSDARLALFDLGLTYRDIQSVYISHLHADHVGGLEWLSFTKYFDPSCEKPHLYINEKLISDLWNKVLSGGLSSIQGVIPDLNTFYHVHPVKDNSFFLWGGIKLQMIQTVHIMSAYTIIPSYGLMFKINNLNVFLTTDTQFCPHQIMEFYDQADLIFHDCETAQHPSGVHAHYNELLSLDLSVRNKMWLYHYNPGLLPKATQDGFRGFIVRGQCFDFNNKATL